jgi:hypothetical protein
MNKILKIETTEKIVFSVFRLIVNLLKFFRSLSINMKCNINIL